MSLPPEIWRAILVLLPTKVFWPLRGISKVTYSLVWSILRHHPLKVTEKKMIKNLQKKCCEKIVFQTLAQDGRRYPEVWFLQLFARDCCLVNNLTPINSEILSFEGVCPAHFKGSQETIYFKESRLLNTRLNRTKPRQQLEVNFLRCAGKVSFLGFGHLKISDLCSGKLLLEFRRCQKVEISGDGRLWTMDTSEIILSGKFILEGGFSCETLRCDTFPEKIISGRMEVQHLQCPRLSRLDWQFLAPEELLSIDTHGSSLERLELIFPRVKNLHVREHFADEEKIRSCFPALENYTTSKH